MSCCNSGRWVHFTFILENHTIKKNATIIACFVILTSFVAYAAEPEIYSLIDSSRPWFIGELPCTGQLTEVAKDGESIQVISITRTGGGMFRKGEKIYILFGQLTEDDQDYVRTKVRLADLIKKQGGGSQETAVTKIDQFTAAAICNAATARSRMDQRIAARWRKAEQQIRADNAKATMYKEPRKLLEEI